MHSCCYYTSAAVHALSVLVVYPGDATPIGAVTFVMLFWWLGVAVLLVIIDVASLVAAEIVLTSLMRPLP